MFDLSTDSPEYHALMEFPKEFHEKLGASDDRELYLEFLNEEFEEFVYANLEFVLSEKEDTVKAFAEVLKELGDVTYIFLAIIYFSERDNLPGIEGENYAFIVRQYASWLTESPIKIDGITFTEIVTRIHQSNLSKINPETGEVERDARGKVLKGAFYKAPDLTDIAERLLAGSSN